ncbi:MAG: cell division initiation protein [Synergistaceae bacterium]|nr:cell division initiation protein [Synergistaceae bacterium]HOA76596.1 DivIVA domain-containing protein [Thermosynergistes sp.]MDI3531710.1 cell division initiation protein [Synergistaceae bacterium]HOK20492.1 DivIVA domain-containing protein [Thermosynergistes sp.]HPZ75807.1 DivIVA domain-containing protein [Thermosynergistes sp.]
MTELLKALDVINQTFKRALRGYNPVEVDEFLDRVADSLQAYAERCVELERELERLKEQIREYKGMRDSLQEALLMAQKSADERVKAAEKQAEAIVAEARAQAERLLKEAEDHSNVIKEEMSRLQRSKQDFIAEFRALITRYQNLIDYEGEES